MVLRSLVFSSDEATGQPISQVLTSLNVEVESCPDAAAAVEKLIHESFQIVIIDWDQQPEAGLLLTTARDRKPAERPLTLAIVSNDAGVPKALQAGANSILRKPILPNQVKDTLKTARDLLRARQESAAAAAQAVAAGPTSRPPSITPASEPVLRAGEFLQTTAPAAGTQFDIDSDFQKSAGQASAEALDPLAELEPMAAAVSHKSAVPPPPPPPPESNDSRFNEPRGLEWYLNRKGITRPAALNSATAAAAAPAPAPAKPELIGFEQNPSPTAPARSPWSSAETASTSSPAAEETEQKPAIDRQAVHEQKTEAELFAYIAGENQGPEERSSTRPPFRLGKGTISAAAVLAVCAVIAAPQAPWHSSLKAAWGHGQQALHAWLNPQPVTPPQAPTSHENFGRAGDEYKLPAAENIPDATTDPSQIRVVPVVDPTAKKPTDAAQNPDQPAGPEDATGANANEAAQSPAVQVQENLPPQPAGPNTLPPAAAAAGTTSGITAGTTTGAPGTLTGATPTGATPTGATPGGSAPSNSPANAPASSAPPRAEATVAVSSPRAALPTQPPAPKNPTPHPTSSSQAAAIPLSLKSQMASMTPDASGNKPVEAALPSIEPVSIPETTARGLLTDQPATPYPSSAKGQQGTVILQVLIGRDGVVQDAKFLQGSLAFARAAIDSAKQWKFKPYTMNGRVVSVQTQLTISFKPGS